MNILREGQHPLVIFPEGEIYHHHEELDSLNDGVATILLRAAEKLPPGRKAYAVPVAIRIAHDPSVAATFSETILKLEEDILEQQDYPGPRHAELSFGEPIDVHEFLQAGHLDPKTGVQPMTQLLRHRIQELMNRSERTPAPSDNKQR